MCLVELVADGSLRQTSRKQLARVLVAACSDAVILQVDQGFASSLNFSAFPVLSLCPDILCFFR